MNRKVPKNIFQGVHQGAMSAISSIGSGLSGIVTQPIKGAKQKGVKGFFKVFNLNNYSVGYSERCCRRCGKAIERHYGFSVKYE